MMETDDPQHIWVLIARKLSGEATPAELSELEKLLHNNPKINYSREILNDLWSAQTVIDNQYAENRFKELVVQMQAMGIDEGKFTTGDHFIDADEPAIVNKGVRKKKLLPIILLSVSILGIVAFLKFRPAEAFTAADMLSKNEISTKSGSKTNLVLPDGTRVWLNSSSELVYDKNYGTKLREVTLTGEAYFDVVKNALKPFIIHTSKMDIKVLGTAFNVRCYPGDKTTETSLIRGSIEVTLKERQEKIMLKPNEKLVINSEDEKKTLKINSPVNAATASLQKPMISLSHLTIFPKDSSVVETAWVQNRLIFISETFEDIALKMERWYGVTIVFEDEALRQIKITGTLEGETVAEAFNALQLANISKAPFRYNIKNNIIQITNYKMKKII